MFNKNDPLIGAVQEVMRKNQAERDAVRAVNEKFGVVDRRALPHEQQANWDAAYAKVLTEGVEALDEVSIKRMKRELSAAGEREIEARDGFGNADAEKKADRNAKSIKAKYGQRGLDAVERRAQHGLYGDRIRKSKSMEEELSPKQKKLAAIAGNKKKIDAPDLAAARKGHASHIEEEQIDEISGAMASRYLQAKTKRDYDKKGSMYTSKKSKSFKDMDKDIKGDIRALKTIERDKKKTSPSMQKEEALEEKAVSKAQHRFFGLVRGIQKGEATGSAKAKEAAASMSTKEVRKFAKTKEKGLPEKK